MTTAPTFLESLEALERDGLVEIESIADTAALEAWRVAYLGSKGRLKAAMAGMKDVPKEGKPAAGQKANAVKTALEDAFEAKKSGLGGGGGTAPMVDLTEPGLHEARALGRRHILMQVRAELVEVCARLGFAVVSGPELEDDEHNFVKLNIPADHPARDPIDNFYVDDPAKTERPRMLRSQTSTVQIRTMEKGRQGGLGAAPEGHQPRPRVPP